MKNHVKTTHSGFSLIEILAAMAILMMIVVIMGVIFRDANRSWTLGTSRVLNTATGRTAIDMIAQDLQYAVADNVLTFYAGPERNEDAIEAPYDSVRWHEISFVSLQNNQKKDSGGSPLRTAVEVSYFVKKDNRNPDRYALIRTAAKASIVNNANAHCYKDPSWHRNRMSGVTAPPLAENIACLQFHCRDSEGSTQTTYDSRSNDNMLPEYVDIYLEVVDDRAAKELADMAALKRRNPSLVFRPGGGTRAQFLERNIKRYTKRVFFRNRHGYKPGR